MTDKTAATSRHSSPTPGSVIWIDPKAEMPDDETTVLIALSDGEVWTGHHADGMWLFCEGSPVDQGEGTSVEWWAEFPLPPNDQAQVRGEKQQKGTNDGK